MPSTEPRVKTAPPAQDDRGRLGTVIDGRYRLDALLGKGGMGVVYRGEHVAIRRAVAVKLLHPTLAAMPELRSRFEREAIAIGRIDHPNCVDVSDFGKLEDGSLFLVMELLDGRSLGDLMDADAPIAPHRALAILRHVLSGLGHAHAAGIVHRDVKPENVYLVPKDGDPDFAKILDFGIAKVIGGGEIDDGVKLTQAGVAFGTPIYMSPEQCKGAHDVDGRSDVYSLGCVLFCMLTGRPPFDYESAGEIIAAHLKEDPPSATSVRPEISDDWRGELEAILARCLAKDPNARFQSMAEVAAAITEALGDGVSDPRTTAPRLRRAATPDPVAAQSGTPVPGPAMSSLARPTTLSSATGATQPPNASARFAGPPKRTWTVPVISLSVIVAGVAVAVVVMAGQGTPAKTQAPAATPATVQPQPQPQPQTRPEAQPQTPPALQPQTPPPPVPRTATVVEPPVTPVVTPPVETPVRPGKKKPSIKPTPTKGTHETKPSKQGEGNAGDVDRGD